MCARLTEAQVVCEWVCDVRACMLFVAGAGCTTPAVMAAVQGLVLVREACMCYSCRRDELILIDAPWTVKVRDVCARALLES